MGYELRLTGAPEGDHVTALCTTAGYSALCRWFESLPAEKYPALTAWAETDSFSGTDVLVLQVDRALVDDPPGDPDVAAVANRFADLLGNGYDVETAKAIS